MHSVSARKAPEVSGSYPATRRAYPLTLVLRSGSHRDGVEQLSRDSRPAARNGEDRNSRRSDSGRTDEDRRTQAVDERLAARVTAMTREHRGENGYTEHAT